MFKASFTMSTLQQVHEYFYGMGRKRRSKPMFKYYRSYDLRDVVRHYHKDIVNKAVTELSGEQPGSKTWLANYQAGLTAVIEGLDDDLIERYVEEAAVWTDRKPPPEVQQEYVLRHYPVRVR